ncbi:iron-siderophore ABC transporter substrate-binding protein [Actinomycetes bacterium KLBMP 9797]
MRRPFVLLAALLVAATTTACGGSDSGGDTAGSTGAAGAAFPVTLEHKYGSTTVPASPKKVVTVGLTEQDALLALGVVPVATTEWLGGYPGAIGPWAQSTLNGATLPEVLKDTGGGPQFERIAALKPDLILALYSGITQEQYQTLTEIAPTVAQPKEFKDYGVPWQEITKRVGKAVGKGAEAEKLVADVEAKFATAKQQNPGFQGATALMVTPYEGYFVYGRQDARSRVLTDLGFTLPSELDQVVGDAFGAGISGERTDMLDVDALVWIVADLKDAPARLHQDRLYAPLDVVTQGREVFIPESTEYGHATSFVSALSLPYLLEKLVPQLAAAVDGNASTAVPAS